MECSHLFSTRLKLIILISLAIWFLFILLNIIIYSIQADFNQINHQLPHYNGTSKNQTSKQLFDSNYNTIQLPPDKLKKFNVILYWTKYFNQDIMNEMNKFGQDNLLFRPKSCYHQYPNCLITSNRKYLPVSRTLIFHWRDYDRNDLPALKNAKQFWTLFNLESPIYTGKLPKIDQKFDIVATYRQDSDIPIFYGQVVPRSSPINISEHSVDMRYKTKYIAWFVSNCNTQSRREVYVDQLSKYLPIDIYGRCGKYKCPHSDKCYLVAAKKYLFYLSFENSLCRDYVTEKLFNILNYDMIPVVFGGTNYSAILPPNSYIDANEKDPEELARLLLEISSNRQLYLNYFKWRQTHSVFFDSDYASLLYCKLCHLMNNNDQSFRSKTPTEINHWYFDDACHESKYKP